ncbi:regulatory protein RecX [Pseudomarimonas arenosa]|uniref:regulatory protein RecX n=1 Tax=Pseudomarimonas arenosa TaxID=2774145 RepID=UPI002FC39CC4
MKDKRTETRSALQVAVGLLSRREHSARDLKRKLEARGIEPEQVDAALSRLQDVGLQDEMRFAESLVRQRIAAGYGPMYLRAELSTHRLSESLIERALEAAQADWRGIAADLIARRFAEPPSDLKQRRRAQSLLMRRGFDAETIRSVLKS